VLREEITHLGYEIGVTRTSMPLCTTGDLEVSPAPQTIIMNNQAPWEIGGRRRNCKLLDWRLEGANQQLLRKRSSSVREAKSDEGPKKPLPDWNEKRPQDQSVRDRGDGDL